MLIFFDLSSSHYTKLDELTLFNKTKYRKFDRSQNEITKLRRDYYECVNEALEEAGFDVRYSPEKQSVTPQEHKGKAATALEKKGVETAASEHNKTIRQDNLMEHFTKPLDKPLKEPFIGSLNTKPERKDWNQQVYEWQMLRESSMKSRDGFQKSQGEVTTPPSNRTEKVIERAREGAKLGTKQSYVSKVKESRGWER